MITQRVSIRGKDVVLILYQADRIVGIRMWAGAGKYAKLDGDKLVIQLPTTAEMGGM